MITIDFSFKGKIDKLNREKFYELCILERDKFDDILCELSKKNINKFYYWFRTPSSRNTISSPLFHNYISIIFFNKFIIKKKIKVSKIITDSKVLYKFFRETLKINLIPIKVIYKKNNRNQKLSIYYRLINECFNRVIQLILYKLYYHIPKFTGKICLVDLAIFNNKIDINRFYSNNIEILNKDNRSKKIFVVPTIENPNLKKIYKFVRSIKSHKTPIILKEYNLSFYKLLNIYFSFFTQKKIITLKDNQIKSIFSKLVNEEINQFLSISNSIEGLINYNFFKNLSKYNLKIFKCINWNENQIKDRGWNLGANTFLNKNINFGIQNYITSPMYLSQNFPMQIEIEANLFPKNLYVTGKSQMQFLKKKIKNVKIELAPSFRFYYLWDIKRENSQDIKKIVFLMPAYDDNYYILNSLINVVKNLNFNCQLIIKPHPIIDIKTFFKNFKFFDINYEITNKHIKDLLVDANVVISGLSSVIFESLCLKNTNYYD